MTYLAADTSRTLDQALANASSGRFTGFVDSRADFQTDGATFNGNLPISGQLTDGDTGAIGGANASGGPTQSAESVVENVASRSGDDDLEGFEESWEKIMAANSAGPKQAMQICARVGETLEICSFAMNGLALDIMEADVTVDPIRVILKIVRSST